MVERYELMNPDDEKDEELIEDNRERTKMVLSRPEFMDRVYESLCMGASLLEIAESRKIRFSDLSKYVNQPERQSLFLEALDMRRQYTVDKLIGETLKISGSDLRKLFGDNGELLPPDKWPDDIGSAIESVEVKEVFENINGKRAHVGYTKKIKLWNKLKAIQMLGQENNVFKEKQEVSVDDDLKKMIAASYSKEEKDIIEIKEAEDGIRESGTTEE